MDAASALREMIETSGLTHRQIEARAGRYGGWIGQTMARPHPGADLLASIATACGYRLELVPMDGGETITIGEGLPDRDGAPSIEQARALLSRAASILDQMDGATTTTD